MVNVLKRRKAIMELRAEFGCPMRDVLTALTLAGDDYEMARDLLKVASCMGWDSSHGWTDVLAGEIAKLRRRIDELEAAE